MINSVSSMISMLNSVSEGNLMSACTGLVSKLQSRGTSRCDIGSLCGATGLLAEECDAIMMGICVLSDEMPNPCAWLMDQFSGGNRNICRTIADELNVAGRSGHRRLIDALVESKKLRGSDYRKGVDADFNVRESQIGDC
jgi:hypothetical protein